MIFASFFIKFVIKTSYRLAASSKSVPSSISSIPTITFCLLKRRENFTIRPAKVDISSRTFCGSSIMSSNSLKVPIFADFTENGSRYLLSKQALIKDFKSIDFPPAFTPVISKTFFVKSMLIRFGFLSAGWANSHSFISLELSLSTKL